MSAAVSLDEDVVVNHNGTPFKLPNNDNESKSSLNLKPSLYHFDSVRKDVPSQTPVSSDEVIRMFHNGDLTESSLVRQEGVKEWRKIMDVKELFSGCLGKKEEASNKERDDVQDKLDTRAKSLRRKSKHVCYKEPKESEFRERISFKNKRVQANKTKHSEPKSNAKKKSNSKQTFSKENRNLNKQKNKAWNAESKSNFKKKTQTKQTTGKENSVLNTQKSKWNRTKHGHIKQHSRRENRKSEAPLYRVSQCKIKQTSYFSCDKPLPLGNVLLKKPRMKQEGKSERTGATKKPRMKQDDKSERTGATKKTRMKQEDKSKRTAATFLKSVEEKYFENMVTESKMKSILGLTMETKMVSAGRLKFNPMKMDHIPDRKKYNFTFLDIYPSKDLTVTNNIWLHLKKVLNNTEDKDVNVRSVREHDIDFVFDREYTKKIKASLRNNKLDGLVFWDKSRAGKVAAFVLWGFVKCKPTDPKLKNEWGEQSSYFLYCPVIWLDHSRKHNPQWSLIAILSMLSAIRTKHIPNLLLARILRTHRYALEDIESFINLDEFRMGSRTETMGVLSPMQLLYDFQSFVRRLKRVGQKKAKSYKKRIREKLKESEKVDCIADRVKVLEQALKYRRVENTNVKIRIAESFYYRDVECRSYKKEYASALRRSQKQCQKEISFNYDSIADVVCENCGKDTMYGNLLVICDGCEKKCFGIEYIPEGSWFCHNCKNR